MTQDITDTYGNDPFAPLKAWMKEAEQTEPNDPEAVCLATCDGHGRPSARMVLIKDAGSQGFKFHTNERSRKGQDMDANPYGALCFYWKSTRKQIRAEGRIEQVGTAESDTYFKTRPRARQISAWASQQSKPYEHAQDLRKAIEEYTDKFAGNDVPRPAHWHGYRLIPERLEFWIGHEDRLHTRFEYILKNGVWTARWLYP